MRVFVAVELSADVKKALGQLQRELKSITDSARWVATESIHITLKFIGEIPEQRLEKIDEALVGLNWKPFTVSVCGVGFFPGKRSPRVFWAGMSAPTMPELAEELDVRMERLGFEKEERAFRPHVTLARARDARMETGLVTAASKYENFDFGSFTVDRIFLIQSTLKPSGPVYNKLKQYLLEPRPPSSSRQ